jgi:hypothetical protein
MPDAQLLKVPSTSSRPGSAAVRISVAGAGPPTANGVLAVKRRA